MPSKTRSRTDPFGPYILELDEALLAEAVAAVEAHRPHHEPAEEEVEVDIEVPTGTPGADPPTVTPSDFGMSPPEEEDTTSEPGLDLATMAAEWTRVNAELERLKVEMSKLRVERDAALQRADAETRERVRVAARVKRMTTQAQESIAVASEARDVQRKAEAAVHQAREAAQSAEDGVGRMRERLRRQEEDQRLHGHAPVVVELLPILENLERAALHREASPEALRDGLQIIHDQFRNALGRVGVARIDASRGTLFQPSVHEAVIHVAVSDALPGTVIAELQPGYMLNGRLIRAARVSVAAAAGVGAYEAPPPVAPRRTSLSEGDALALPDDGSSESDVEEDDSEE